MQANGVLRIRQPADQHRALTMVLVSIQREAKRAGIPQDDLEELLLLKLLCSRAAIPFELREPEEAVAPI